MKRSYWNVLSAVAATLLLSSCNVAVFDTKGVIADQQKDLIIVSTLLMLIVVIPVLIMTFLFAWRFRASNSEATYRPEWAHNSLLEAVWWGVPIAIILVLSIITWRTSHSLDPYRPLESEQKPITVQVVALNWKWLFIYPEEGVASVNFLQIPVHRPINFRITAEAPMNSFWIPRLGGQVYAMEGMQTKLHLMASEAGDYEGVSANFSGEGFSGMKFITRAGSEDDYEAWIAQQKQSTDSLTMDRYKKLVLPSQNEPVRGFSYVEPRIFHTIMMQFMAPMEPTGHGEHHQHETMTPPPASMEHGEHGHHH